MTGSKGYWFTPWDNLVRLVGVENLFYDLIDRPDFIHKLLKRFLDNNLIRMKKYNELGIWASNNTNANVGSGGYGYTEELDQKRENNIRVETSEIWGCGNAQIFSDVSPEMHWEFSLKYEIEWMKYFGLNYYGCCEPLHGKIEILKKIPNLRKISMSPWANLKVASEQAGKEYVLSCKPNPSIFVGAFDEKFVRKSMEEIIKNTQNNNIEIIMKDVSTIERDFNKIIRWSQIIEQIVG